MLPLKISIRNIGPYKNAELDFRNVPGNLIAICGLNGAGKTTLMESVFASLYRTFPSRDAGIYRYCTDRHAGYEFWFEANGKTYATSIMIDAKTNKMEAVIADHSTGTGIPLNDGKTSTFDEQIEKILGTPDQVLASSFGSQKKKGNFVGLAKSKRKDLFIRMIGCTLLQGISEQAKKQADTLSPAKAKSEGELVSIKELAEKELIDIEAIQAAMDEHIEKIGQLRADYDAISGEIMLAEQKLSSIAIHRQELKAKECSLAEIDMTMPGLITKMQRVDETAGNIDKWRTLVSGDAEIIQSESVKLSSFADKEKRAKELSELKKGIESRVSKLSEERPGVEKKLQELKSISENIEVLRELVKSLEGTQDKIDATNRNINHSNVSLAAINRDEVDRANKTREIERELSKVRAKKDALLVKLKDAEEQSKILEEVPCGGEGQFSGCMFLKRAKEAEGNIPIYTADSDNAQSEILVLEAQIRDLPKIDYASKADLEKNLDAYQVEIEQLQADARTLGNASAKLVAAESALENIALYQEKLLGIDNSTAASAAELGEIIAEFQKISDELTAKNAIETVVSNAKSRLESSKLELAASEAARDALPSIKASIASYEEKASGLTKDIAALRVSIDDLSKDVEGIEGKKVQQERIKENISSSEHVANNHRERLATAKQVNSDIESARLRKSSVESEIDRLTFKIAARMNVSRAFGPMEIQSYEIDSAGPAVSSLTNSLLFDCFGPRFSTQFITQMEKADKSGFKDEFDVLVTDTEKDRQGPIDDLSVGESTIVSEAIALAIALYNKDKHGISWDALFRDEVSGSLDALNAPQYIKMLETARKTGNFVKLFFISHQDHVKDLADARLIVRDGAIHIEA